MELKDKKYSTDKEYSTIPKKQQKKYQKNLQQKQEYQHIPIAQQLSYLISLYLKHSGDKLNYLNNLNNQIF